MLWIPVIAKPTVLQYRIVLHACFLALSILFLQIVDL
jgi:hypothetical protein